MVKPVLCVSLLLISPLARAAGLGLFELRAVAETPSATTQEYSYVADKGGPARKVYLEEEVLLDSSAIRSATLEHEDNGQPRILIVLTKAGARQFGEITTKFVHKKLGIVLGGQLQTAPVVNEPILGGSLVVSGSFSEPQAAELVTQIKASLPKTVP